MKLDHLLRVLAVGSALVAGSCSVANNGESISEDGARNHPITVEPSYRDLKVQFAASADGMSPEDAAKFDSFLTDYRLHGNGSLGISVPSGASSRAAITYFGERAAASGISRDKILVSTHDAANGDLRVEVNYVTYQARTARCGDWSDDLSLTLMNNTPKNFGCAVQQNIAAMVSDPRDLVSPRGLDASDAGRRVTVINNYEQGKVTQAEKHTADATVEQSSGASKVGSQ